MKVLTSIVFLISIHVFVVGCKRICENEKIIKVTYAKNFFPKVGDEPLSLYDAKLCSIEASNNFNFIETVENGFGAVTLPNDFTDFIKGTEPFTEEELREKFIDLFKLTNDMILIQMPDPYRRESAPHSYWHIDFPEVSPEQVGPACGFEMKDVSAEDWDTIHVLNLWIPVKAPFSMPLGFMDLDTVSTSQTRWDDQYKSLGPPPKGTMNTIYYLPNMHVGQAYIFDTRTQIHGAFNDGNSNEGRDSIDQRFAILKAKSKWALDVARRGKQQFYIEPMFVPRSRWVDKNTGEPIEHPECKSFRCATSAEEYV